MLQTNLKFTFRLLSGSKLFSLAVILGLSVSIASAILVMDYATFEMSYDKFFKNSQRVYRIHHTRYQNNEALYRRAITLPEVGIAMKEYFPEIETSTRLFPISTNIEPVFTAILRSGERKSYSEPNAYAADSMFCSVFDLDFIYGEPNTALIGLDKTVISRSTAMRYFGTTDVVGETLKGKDGDLTITGVFHDLPANTHFRLDILLSWFEIYGDGSRFTYDGFYNYVLFKDDADAKNVVKRMPDFVSSYMGEYYKSRPEVRSEFDLQPLTGIHLDSHLDGEMAASGNRNTIDALLLVSLFMIVIAVINHVNLNTSRSLQRLKEVIVRKTIGSSNGQLTLQFLTEAWTLSFIAVIVGLILAYLFYPVFNSLFNSQVSLNILQWPAFWGALIIFIVCCSLLCGFYPAFLMSQLKLREALKGSSVGNRNPWFQRTLVTGQFALSLILVVGTYAVFEQVKFMKKQDLGFDIRQKLVIKLLPSYGEEGDTVFIHKTGAIKNELINRSLCDASTISSSIPGRINEWRGTAGLSGKGDAAVIRTNLTRVDHQFLETFKVNLVAGRNFNDSPGDNQYLIINDEAARQFGLTPDEAIGQKIDMMGHREIIGVVSSFHELGLHDTLMPSMYIMGAGYTKFLTVSMNQGAITEQLSDVEKIWRSHFPDKPFQYFFLDEYFNRQYQADVAMSRSIGLFAGIAICVACLGLFSLSAFMVHRKTKEIGIKKIFGASVARITGELYRTFITPIFVSALVGVPMSYFLVKWWLNSYPYKVEITFALFSLPVLLLLMIGTATIIFQSIQSARRNPMETLKSE